MVFRIAILVAVLALSACSVFHETNVSSTAPAEAAAVAGGPPIVGGVYSYPDCEGEGGCNYRNWRVVQLTPLLAEQSRAARVISTLTPGEWVHVEQLETRLVPHRGIVREDTSDLRAGEVVYELENVGEGYVAVWRRGEYGEYGSEDLSKVDWDRTETPEATVVTLGTWARVTRESGQAGWVRLEYGYFECLGSLAGDPDCRD